MVTKKQLHLFSIRNWNIVLLCSHLLTHTVIPSSLTSLGQTLLYCPFYLIKRILQNQTSKDNLSTSMSKMQVLGPRWLTQIVQVRQQNSSSRQGTEWHISMSSSRKVKCRESNHTPVHSKHRYNTGLSEPSSPHLPDIQASWTQTAEVQLRWKLKFYKLTFQG